MNHGELISGPLVSHDLRNCDSCCQAKSSMSLTLKSPVAAGCFCGELGSTCIQRQPLQPHAYKQESPTLLLHSRFISSPVALTCSHLSSNRTDLIRSTCVYLCIYTQVMTRSMSKARPSLYCCQCTWQSLSVTTHLANCYQQQCVVWDEELLVHFGEDG